MLKKINWLRVALVTLLVLAIVLILFRKEIAENDLTQQKLEILKALQQKDMDKAGELSKTFLDSLTEKVK